MTKSNLHWLAGLLEGEGYFGNKVMRGRKYARITLNMTDEDVVRKAHKLLACGNVFRSDWNNRKNPKHSVTYTLQINGAEASRWMKMLVPLMGQRRQSRINEILGS